MSWDARREYLLTGWRRVSRRGLINEARTQVLSYYDERAKAYWYHDRLEGFLWPEKGVISCDAFVDRNEVPDDCAFMVFDGDKELFCCERAAWLKEREEFLTPRARILVLEAPLWIFQALNKATGEWRGVE